MLCFDPLRSSYTVDLPLLRYLEMEVFTENAEKNIQTIDCFGRTFRRIGHCCAIVVPTARYFEPRINTFNSC